MANYDIVFLLDNTGSMSTYVTAVKNNITQFANSLNEKNVNHRLGLVSFGDVNESIGKVKNYGFGDAETFKNNVDSILNSIDGGGDSPESGLEALVQGDQSALAMINSSDAKYKRFVVVTDASFHNQGETGDGDFSAYLNSSDVINTLNAAGVVVDVIGTPRSFGYSDPCQDEWEPFANATGGKFYDINGNYSMIFEEIGVDIADDVIKDDDNVISPPLPTLPGGYIAPTDNPTEKPVINSGFEGRITLAQWSYGFTPTENSPLFGGATSNEN